MEISPEYQQQTETTLLLPVLPQLPVRVQVVEVVVLTLAGEYLNPAADLNLTLNNSTRTTSSSSGEHNNKAGEVGLCERKLSGCGFIHDIEMHLSLA